MSAGVDGALREMAARPLSIHPRIRPNRPADAPWVAGMRATLQYAVGVLDPAEVVTVRHVDRHKPGHDSLWPDRFHGRWRWTPDRGVVFMDGHAPSDADREIILDAVARELGRRS